MSEERIIQEVRSIRSIISELEKNLNKKIDTASQELANTNARLDTIESAL